MNWLLRLLGPKGRLEAGLLAAAKAGDVDKIENLLAKGANKNALELSKSGKRSGNALHIAALQGHSRVVQVLVDAGVDVNHRDEYGSTPLHMAATLGVPEIAGILGKARGVDLDARDNSGWTALHRACILDRTDFIRALIDAGADMNATISTPSADEPPEFKNLVGMTPLMFAQTFGKNAAAAVFIAAGATNKAT